MGPKDESVVLVKEPLKTIIDSGDAAALEALVRDARIDLFQPYDDYRTPSLLHRASRPACESRTASTRVEEEPRALTTTRPPRASKKTA